jgi:3-deoxy-D-manno-octulosonic-acid transferase
VGNLKFDAARLDERRAFDVPAMLRQLGVPADAPVLVAGSTHDGEEMILAEMAKRLRAKFPNFFLVLVPRHFERCRDLAQKLRARDVKFMLRSEINPSTKLEPGALDCLLVNTTGELKAFYEPATLVFVGKSLTAMGGQNPIEPAALGKPVVFGPNMQNFMDVTRIFLAQNAAVQVNDAAALEKTLADLLANEGRRAELGRNALKVVAENRGALDRTVEIILTQLKARGIYIAPEK